MRPLFNSWRSRLFLCANGHTACQKQRGKEDQTSHASLNPQLSTLTYQLVESVVFLRAINVGSANRCQPAAIAKQLSKFGVINIGAVGTFVVREDVSESALRAAFARKLPFKCEIMICPARDLIKLVSNDPFSEQPSRPDITRFVSVLAKRPSATPFV